MFSPGESDKSCQGRMDVFYTVTILPEFPSQSSGCQHKVESTPCYKYHLCNSIGGGTPTGPCNQHTECVPGPQVDCDIAGAVYNGLACPPKPCLVK